jgi:Ala-tRNA(Pro) deacylase
VLEEKELLIKLDKSSYLYKLYRHEPLFTVGDSVNKRGKIEGAHSKNLFLKNKKNKFFLFSCLETTKIDLKKLSKTLDLGNISFARDEYLKKILGVLPGSVTPFGLLNDTDEEVEFYLDKAFLSEKIVNFHPLVNTSTLSLAISDFMNFLIENKKKVNIFDFNDYTLINN